MFNQLLNSILEEHPLLGLEKDDQNKGHLTGLDAPAWVLQGPIYEVFIRNFSPQGNFAGLRDKIPYLADLGVKTLWLMPVYPIGQEGKKGTLGSPYAIKDYNAINPSLGTPADLKNLIDAVHQKGMKLILDMVANHMAIDNVWRKNSPDYFLSDEQGTFTRKIAEWSDIVDLDYSNPALRKQMRNILSTWVREYGIDGFRCDVAGLVPLDFWGDVYNDLRKLNKDVFLLAEWESVDLHTSAFHASYDWSSHFVLEDIYRGKRPASDAVSWVMEKEANHPRNALPLRFTENHDLDRTREKFGEESFYPFVVYNFLLYGIPLLYAGQEFGAKYIPHLFNKDPIPWDQFDKQIFGFYKKLIELRKDYPAFSDRRIKPLGNDKPDQVVSIEKGDQGQKILAILNFSPESMKVKLDTSDIDHNLQTFIDLFSGNTFKRSDLEKIKIKPFEYYVLQSNRVTPA